MKIEEWWLLWASEERGKGALLFNRYRILALQDKELLEIYFETVINTLNTTEWYT